jgi:hypothetical protein
MASLVMGLEQGIIALLGSKSTGALLRLVPASDLILACFALITVLHAVPETLPVFGKVSTLISHVLSTVALNTLLQWVSTGSDPPLACFNLLAVFFLAESLTPGAELTLTAQYLLVASLSTSLRAFGHGEVLPVAWAISAVPESYLPKDLTALAQLVTVESLSAGLQDWLPASLLLPSTVIVLYLFAPFMEKFPALGRLYRFAVFAISTDVNFATVPPWLVGAGLWGLWQVEPDPVSKRLAAVAGSNLVVLTLLDAMRFAVDNDPALILVTLLVSIRILEAAMSPRVP